MASRVRESGSGPLQSSVSLDGIEPIALGSTRSEAGPTFDKRAMSTKRPSTRRFNNGGSNTPATPGPINLSCGTTSTVPGATRWNGHWNGIARHCCGGWGRRWTVFPMRNCSRLPRSAASVMMRCARCTSITSDCCRCWPRRSGGSEAIEQGSAHEADIERLQRSLPTLSPEGARQVLENASAAELAELRDTAKIPLRQASEICVNLQKPA